GGGIPHDPARSRTSGHRHASFATVCRIVDGVPDVTDGGCLGGDAHVKLDACLGDWPVTVSRSERVFVVLPDPGGVGTLDELVEGLRLLRSWAGGSSYSTITGRVNAAWKAAGRPEGELTKKATVVDCFKTGRRRLNTDLVVAVVAALHPDAGYVAQWRQALLAIT